jgi:hypothetical protein
LSPLGTSATSGPIAPAPGGGDDDDDNDECGAVGGMRIGRGNRITWRKPAPVILSKIPHDQTWDRNN